ncbi:MAG: hypothetical protein F6K61_00880 [Sphaerospermopsis sp. SIO1G1]|nr:hypothetical protein [Sphaerospermopsis sp. SIO1G1]
MNTEKLLLENWRVLPLDKQIEVLEFVQSLNAKTASKPRKHIKGIWANLKFEITEQEITEAKQEMWGNFPKDIDL